MPVRWEGKATCQCGGRGGAPEATHLKNKTIAEHRLRKASVGGVERAGGGRQECVVTCMKSFMSNSAPSSSISPLSYRPFFSGSDNMLYASLMAWNFSFALGSSGFLSGWHVIASFRYAFLMSVSDASLSRPRAA